MSSNEWLPAQIPFDLVRRGFAPDQVDELQLARAVSLSRLGRTEAAVDLATQLARRDPGANPARLDRLMALADRMVGLGRLMEVFRA